MNVNRKIHRLGFWLSALTYIGTLAVSAAGAAPNGGGSVVQSKSPEYQPLGLRAGSFLLYPVLELGTRYDDNIFRLPDGLKRDDTIFQVKPSVSMQSNWSRHALNAYASADLGYYSDYSGEDYTDYTISTDGQFDVRRDSFAFGEIGYAHLHEDRSSTDDRFGAEPTQYDRGFFSLGYSHRFNRLGIKAAYDYETLDYDDVPRILGGSIDNSDRNRSRDELTMRIAYGMRPQFDVYLEGAVNAVDYDKQFDRSNRQRSSDGYRLVAGLSIDITAILIGDVYLGHLRQSYDDDIFDDIDDPTFGFGLTWYVTNLTTLSGDLGRAPQETTSPTASGYLATKFSIRVDHELRRNILLFGNMLYSNNDYQQALPGAKENENTLGLGIGAKYLFNRRYYATAEYYYRRRDSDIKIDEYDLNQVSVSVGAQW